METKVPFLDLKAEHAPLREEFDEAIRQVIDSSAFAGGPFVTKFEEQFAAFCECDHAIGLGSGTEALWLTLLAFGVGQGDEVITVPSTFMATAEAITYCGATPTFVDIDERTYTMDPAALESAITKRTKAIIPVHLFGQPADMDPIIEIARAHKLFVIEDAAQAHGAEYKGQKVGTLGDAGCFSFYPGKNLGAFGEAGAVITNDFDLQEKVHILRDHGQVRKYYHKTIGWNCRMDGIQAAVLSVKLQDLRAGNELRRAHALKYNQAFAGVEQLVTPLEAQYARHVYHVYAIRTPERAEAMELLASRGIGYGVHYPVPIHLQEAYRGLGHKKGAFPIAERTAEEFLSLPMFPGLKQDQLDLVIEAIQDCSVAAAFS
jgi:dTDP-4-amino-4,6-dideoxygalactose transaminase